jgi:hypothetical protein
MEEDIDTNEIDVSQKYDLNEVEKVYLLIIGLKNDEISSSLFNALENLTLNLQMSTVASDQVMP